MAAPDGNTYGSRNNRLLTDTLRRACLKSPEKLRKMCEALLDKATEGDIPAASFIYDRLEGKPVQRQETDMALSGMVDFKQIIVQGVKPE